MENTLPALTPENVALTRELEQLHIDFTDLYTSHKDMVENESVILTSVYLEKLGNLQLEILEKQTEMSRLKMKMKMIQAAINRNEPPDLTAIELELNTRLKAYYAQIQAQSAAIDDAKLVLSHLISEEETTKLKEIFRVLCKRLHPDLNPNQTEEERELFIRVKAAYDLQRLSDLQNILLYLTDSKHEMLTILSGDEKKERIEHLKKQIEELKEKIEKLKQSFPFTIKALIFDAEYVSQQQEELRLQINTAEEQISKYQNIINLILDE